jgi:SAM-dependent methyltransferase
MMHDQRFSNATNKNATLKIAFGNQLRQCLKRFCGSSRIRLLMEIAMACRALLFIGNKFVCPCCGWSLRAFTHGGLSVRVRPAGSCPRCNSKARHRRDWLYLKENTNLFVDPVRLLHVSPKYALSRRLANRANIQFVGVDIVEGPHITHQVDITEIPFEAESFDAIICIHVLEHIENDRKAIAELSRALKPGGWALLTVPIDLESETYENPQIVSPEERKKHFGEEQHVRIYGFDFTKRLKSCGFDVLLERGDNLPVETMEKYGLLDDENIFYCTKPPVRR